MSPVFFYITKPRNFKKAFLVDEVSTVTPLIPTSWLDASDGDIRISFAGIVDFEDTIDEVA